MSNEGEFEFPNEDSTGLDGDFADGGEKRKTSLSNGKTEKAAKRRRSRAPKDANAPRMPLNGYVRYLNAHRERVKVANPLCNFAEITKLLAAEWSSLPAEEKKKYLEEAEKAKEKYLKELEEYQQTETYKLFVAQQKENSERNNSSTTNENTTGGHKRDSKSDNASTLSDLPGSDSPTFDIPIFTEEFLDHNKMREQELRQLRKLNTEYEEQNAILSKHIDNLKQAIEKLEVEAVQQQNNNTALNQHLMRLRNVLVQSFALITIPGSGETPTIDNIDFYMQKLQQKLIKEKAKENDQLLARVQNIVANLDYNF